jgi:hypothetical protein
VLAVKWQLDAVCEEKLVDGKRKKREMAEGEES